MREEDPDDCLCPRLVAEAPAGLGEELVVGRGEGTTGPRLVKSGRAGERTWFDPRTSR